MGNLVGRQRYPNPPSDVDVTPFISLNVTPEQKTRISERKLSWANAAPADAFVHIFSFLRPADLVQVSLVNSAWNEAVSEPTLWQRVDLSKIYYRVDDRMCRRLLSAPRFSKLQSLSLEGCSAITSKTLQTIQQCCPHIRRLLLTDCNLLEPQALLDFVRVTPIDRLELYGVTEEYQLAQEIKSERPSVNLGFFWMEHCARNGFMPDGRTPGACRHANDIRADRGCWGPIRGRIIYSNRFYHRAGNYPGEVMYSCQLHGESDLTDIDVLTCQMCMRQFRQASMFSPVICRVCYDDENLHDKNRWIELNPQTVQRFSSSDLMYKSTILADRKNLPPSLKSYGHVDCQLDYRLPAALGAIDPSRVPLNVFMDANRPRLDDAVAGVRGLLQRSLKSNETRALLVYDGRSQVEVLADRHVIVDGRDAQEQLQLTMQAWRKAPFILYPILIAMLFVTGWISAAVRVFSESYDGRTDYTYYIRESDDSGFPPELAFIIGAAILVGLLLVMWLVFRFREQCEAFFRRFLVVDIAAIFAMGSLTIMLVTANDWRMGTDWLSLCFVAVNISALGLTALYRPVPKHVHRAMLVVLQIIMAGMMLLSGSGWLVLVLLALVSMMDIISELRPNIRMMPGFLLPPSVELIFNTPKIIYAVGAVRVRAMEFMWYAIIAGLLVFDVVAISAVYVVTLSGVALTVFVLPFFGKRFRPLPIAFIGLLLILNLTEPLLKPHLAARAVVA